MEAYSGFVPLITGPSGAGKTTLALEVVKRFPSVTKVITTTTRQIRVHQGEVHGRDYFFTDKENFMQSASNGGFFEWARVGDNLYGSEKQRVWDLVKSGQNPLFVVDVQGAETIGSSKELPGIRKIFVAPESVEKLEKRLLDRGDDPLDVAKRVGLAHQEMPYARMCHKTIINRDGEIQRATQEILSYIQRGIEGRL